MEERPRGALPDYVVQNIVRRYQALGWSQKKLAEEIGVHHSTLSRILSRLRPTTTVLLAKAADNLGCTLEDLLRPPSGGTDADFEEIMEEIRTHQEGFADAADRLRRWAEGRRKPESR